MSRSKTLLIVTQVYVPDPASVGQHLHDVAREMVRRGWRVVVYTSARGYEDPEVTYPLHEVRDGVRVRRLPLSSFGKSSMSSRLAGAAMFLLQASTRSLATPHVSKALVSTSPPMCAALGVLLSLVKRTPLAYWVMDVNPDQAVALGRIDADAWPVRALDMLNRWVLARAESVVTLDRFMAGRLRAKRRPTGRMAVLPPWPHEASTAAQKTERNPFRIRHGLEDRFVVMYSGNHSPANPLTTLLEAARRLQARQDIVFLFVGGGSEKVKVEAEIRSGAPNIVSLPYQPLSALPQSLSAADLHVVTLGNEVVGMVHPCKVYGAMQVARPVLYIGPRPSHVSDLLDRYSFGVQVDHGDVSGACRAIEALCAMPETDRRTMGHRAAQAVEENFAEQLLCSQFCDLLEEP